MIIFIVIDCINDDGVCSDDFGVFVYVYLFVILGLSGGLKVIFGAATENFMILSVMLFLIDVVVFDVV